MAENQAAMPWLNCILRFNKSSKICPLRRSVESQAKNLVFPLEEYLSPSVVNATFLCYFRVILPGRIG